MVGKKGECGLNTRTAHAVLGAGYFWTGSKLCVIVSGSGVIVAGSSCIVSGSSVIVLGFSCIGAVQVCSLVTYMASGTFGRCKYWQFYRHVQGLSVRLKKEPGSEPFLDSNCFGRVTLAIALTIALDMLLAFLGPSIADPITLHGSLLIMQLSVYSYP